MIGRLRRLPEASKALRVARELMSHDDWDPERLAAFQRERLLEIVRHAAQHSDFYRERFAGIELSDDLDITALPRLDKATMLDCFDALVTDRRLTRDLVERHVAEFDRLSTGNDPKLLGEYRVVATGGTGGQRGVFAYGKGDWANFFGGVLRSYNAYFGFAPRIPRRRSATIGANNPIHTTGRINQASDIGMHRRVFLDARAPIEELVGSLNDFRPDAISTYPSIASLLAERQLAGELDITPELVVTSGETLTADIRGRTVAAWGLEPFNPYGATEVGIMAADCARHAGLHLFSDQVLMEVVDDEFRPVRPGASGSRVLITNLFNRTQPLIRYELSDLVTIDQESCSCGRPFSLLASVDGRRDDVLELPALEGGTTSVHPMTLRSPLVGVSGLSEYRIIQRGSELQVEAVLPGAAEAAVCREISDRLEAALKERGAQAVVQVASVSEIPRHPQTGKQKVIEVQVD